jgi:hypothetical protein
MADSPRRSPRIAEKRGAAPRHHVSLQEEHPYKEILSAKRYPVEDDVPPPPANSRALCFTTIVVGALWCVFLGSVFLMETKEARQPFAWEKSNYWLNP